MKLNFKRIVNLTLLIGGRLKVFTDRYKIDFDINLSTGGTFAGGNITITGMNSIDIASVATNYSYNNKLLLPNQITLAAGYQTGITSLIFQGSAASATVQLDGADKVLSLECSTAYAVSRENTNIITINFETTTLSALISLIAGKLRLIPLFKAIDKPLTDFSYQGSIMGLLNHLRSQEGFNLNIYFRDMCIVAENSVTPDAMPPLVCSTDTGMIGTPMPTFLGCNVKMLLNPLAKPGMSVIVISQFMPQVNAMYKVLNVRHTGSSRDNYFFTELECTKFI